jgi:hypothetical protein
LIKKGLKRDEDWTSVSLFSLARTLLGRNF